MVYQFYMLIAKLISQFFLIMTFVVRFVFKVLLSLRSYCCILYMSSFDKKYYNSNNQTNTYKR